MSAGAVFVSYSRVDKDFVDRLVAGLSDAQIETIVDRRDISAGARWDAEVQKQLDACRALVLVLSPTSVSSDEVMHEVNYGLSKGKLIVPVLHAECEPPYRLRGLQRIDFTGADGFPIDRLIERLKADAVAGPGRGPSDEATEIFAPFLRRLVHEYEHWSEFNTVTPAGHQPTRPMMIEKMASADLYREFVSLGFRSVQLESTGWATEGAGIVTDLDAMWLPGNTTPPNLLLLLGDYGTGKSACAIRLAYTLARRCLQHPEERGRIPVYIDLRDFRRFGKIEEFLVKRLDETYRLAIDGRRLNRLLATGRLVLILDGFDEMASRGSVSQTLENFREIGRVSMPGNSTVLTSRTHYFRSDSEAQAIVGGRPALPDNPLLKALRTHAGTKIVELREFSDEQIRELIERRLGGGEVARVWNELSTRYNLHDLARRPVLLDMILTTIPTLTAQQAEISAADVYQAYTALWIERDDWRSHLTPEGKTVVTQRLAWRMMDGWLKQSRRYDETPDSASIDLAELVPAAGGAAATWLKAGEGSPQEMAERIDYDLRTCSFLRRDPQGRYLFTHRSFLEYFSALHLAETAGDADSPLLQRALASYGADVSWEWFSREVVAFLLAILRGSANKRARMLELTRKVEGFGGNGLSLAWAGTRDLPLEPLGGNLRNAAAYAVDLAGRNLAGANFENAALASPNLAQTVLTGTSWQNAAIRLSLVYDAALGGGGRTVTIASGNGLLSEWDLASGERVRRVHLKSDYVFGTRLNEAANLWLYTTWDGQVHLHRLDDGRRLWSHDGRGAGAGHVALSPDGRYAVAGSWSGFVGIWDCNSGAELGHWNMGDRVQAVKFSPDGRTAVAVADGVFALNPGSEKRTLAEGASLAPAMGTSLALSLSPDGGSVALSLSQRPELRIVDLRTGKETPYTVPVWNCYALAHSPDGSTLAVGGSNGLCLIDLAQGAVSSIVAGSGRELKSIAYSPDAAVIVTSGFDGVVRIWDAPTRALLRVVDVGIDCFAADITGARGFGKRSYRLRADFETWWSGPALKDRLYRCGAVDRRRGVAAGRPRASWSGEEYVAWEASLRWVDRYTALRVRQGRPVKPPVSYTASDLFAGAARGFFE